MLHSYPIRVYLNSCSKETDQTLKRCIPVLSEVIPEAINHAIWPSEGTQTLFAEMVERFATTSHSVCLRDVDKCLQLSGWRKQP